MDVPRLVKRISRDKKGVSPVISTIIIVAIAIAISIAVALYLTGITGTFTRFERLDVTNAYADPATTTINMQIKNSGTSLVTVESVLINGIPTSEDATWAVLGTAVTGTTADGTYTIDGSGGSTNIITIAQGDAGTVSFDYTGKSGQSLEITLHTASGKDYPKVVVIP